MPFRSFLAFLATWSLLSAAPEPLRPRIVIVTMFEVGADTGDVPGEFQFWVERMHLDRVLPLPAAYHDVRLNADGTVLGIVTGMGNTRAAASLMALGLDPRFDLRESYWLIAGIAGIDPADGSVGSAVWAHFVVDGDLAHEIDGRETPPEWPTGYIPLDRKRPYELPQPTGTAAEGHVFELNSALVEWAFQLTRDTPLADNDQLRRRRALFVGYPQALRPPFVLEGDNLAASTFWHGAKLNAWANEWVRYYTSGKGNYVTTAMEDTGTLHALTSLTKAGRVDSARVLLLRTASNYDMQWPGATAAESLLSESGGLLSGYLPALEAAYAVGRRVVDTINAQWDRFEKAPPTLESPAR